MFENAFSFEGRIRRSEFGISFIIYVVVSMFLNVIVAEMPDTGGIFLFAYIPLLWFLWAQGAKRCHDVGNSGWWQLIPFYVLWLIFQDGQPGANKYGDNPKENNVSSGRSYQGANNFQKQENESNQRNTSSGYQGGYSGGHNNSNINFEESDKQVGGDGYKDGDLYN